MKGILREMAASGAMIVFSTHMLEVADSFCDEVVILDSGKVVESGNVDDLKRYKREGSTMKDLFYRAITPNAAHGITPEMEGR
jgi:ABC-2 type transport system ATP-binding protein